MIYRFKDEGEAEEWAWLFIGVLGGTWCCAGGYMNAFEVELK